MPPDDAPATTRRGWVRLLIAFVVLPIFVPFAHSPLRAGGVPESSPESSTGVLSSGVVPPLVSSPPLSLDQSRRDTTSRLRLPRDRSRTIWDARASDFHSSSVDPNDFPASHGNCGEPCVLGGPPSSIATILEWRSPVPW